MTTLGIEREVKKLGTKTRAQISARFFKTGPGEYGAGDVFAGLTSAQIDALAKKYMGLKLPEVKTLLYSPIHEVRAIGLHILVLQFKHGDEKTQKQIFNFYLTNLKRVNNWDLVDMSAHHIVGTYLLNRPKIILSKLAKSKNLWERRASIVATYAFIRTNQLTDTFKLARVLISDQHDLIHKAVGWMLREAGKKDIPALEKFLQTNRKLLPRTTLRYALERLPKAQRQKYLNGKIV